MPLELEASSDFLSGFMAEFVPALKSYILSYSCREILTPTLIYVFPLTTFCIFPVPQTVQYSWEVCTCYALLKNEKREKCRLLMTQKWHCTALSLYKAVHGKINYWEINAHKTSELSDPPRGPWGLVIKVHGLLVTQRLWKTELSG